MNENPFIIAPIGPDSGIKLTLCSRRVFFKVRFIMKASPAGQSLISGSSCYMRGNIFFKACITSIICLNPQGTLENSINNQQYSPYSLDSYDKNKKDNITIHMIGYQKN